MGTLTQGDGQSSCLLSLLRHPNVTVVDQAVHLVNVIASEASGRTCVSLLLLFYFAVAIPFCMH
jgi:hypothetical protein